MNSKVNRAERFVASVKAHFYFYSHSYGNKNSCSLTYPMLLVIGTRRVFKSLLESRPMKNFLVIMLFPFLGWAQSPTSVSRYNNDLEVPEKKIAKKIFYPNPTYGIIEFDLDLIGHDQIQISIRNILARELWTSTITRQERKANLHFLDKGSYLLCIKKMNGDVITTRRLVIITP